MSGNLSHTWKVIAIILLGLIYIIVEKLLKRKKCQMDETDSGIFLILNFLFL